MAKPFKTYDEQIQILKDRELLIEDEYKVKEILSQVNYYNIINGYKNIFLKRDLNGKLIQPERFKENASFKELYSLYSMDSELKSLAFYYLLRFEKLLKTSCAYNFSNQYREPYGYLQMRNYSKEAVDLETVLSNLSTLSYLVNNSKKQGKAAIKHYIENHDEIPLWVLINFLTLGNVSYFYNSLDNKLQAKISRDFGERYCKDYDINEKVEAGELKDIIKISNLFRNIAAHDEVLFSSKLKKPISTTKFNKFFEDKFRGKYLFDLILLLSLVIPKKEYLEFIDKLKSIFLKYRDKFSSVEFDDILQLAGFEKDWNKFFDEENNVGGK